MRAVEEDEDEGVQGGLEDEDEEDAAEEDLIPDLSGVHVEVVDSTHEGTKWLFVYGVHICHKQIECPAEVKWRCSLKIVQTGDGSSALLSSLEDKMDKSSST